MKRLNSLCLLTALLGISEMCQADGCTQNPQSSVMYDANFEILPEDTTPEWITFCPNTSSAICGTISNSVLHVVDNSTSPANLFADYKINDVFESACQDAVMEVCVKAVSYTNSPHYVPIVYLARLDNDVNNDGRAIVFVVTMDAAGFMANDNITPYTWLQLGGNDAAHTMTTNDEFHVYRIVKEADTAVKLYVDGNRTPVLTVPYTTFDTENAGNRVYMAATSSSGRSSFDLNFFRFRIGATDFEAPTPPCCCAADLNTDDVVDGETLECCWPTGVSARIARRTLMMTRW